ncbi:solute carrier family 15 member 5 [Podargus strigoides]
MLAANRRDMQEKLLWNHTADKEQRLLSGRSNHAGNLSQSQKLQEAICMLLVELCERFTFFGIDCNMILFCTVKLDYRNYQAAIVNTCFVGTSMLAPVLVGWLAEYLVGRIKLVCICMFLHFLVPSTALLPVVAFPFDIYIDRQHILHTLTKREQKIVFDFALLTASPGIGGTRAIVCPLSAYNLEDCGLKELLSFFNWFYWLINLNSAVVLVSISYIQESVARNLGFLIPFVSLLMAVITIHMVCGEMIYKPKTDSSLLTTFGVIASALKTCCVRYHCFSRGVANWLNHAKENCGGQYSETQVESTKSLARLFPLFAFRILYRTCIIQMVVGQLSAALSMMVAGFSEIHRKHLPQVEQMLSEEVLLVSSMPCFHLAPQYILLGVAEALVTPSCNSLLSFWLVPERIRGISMQFLTLFNGAGCFMGAFFVQTAHTGTQGNWFPHLLHEGKLERFFFFLASLIMVNTLGFWTIVHRYNNLNQEYANEFRGSLPEEKLLKHEKPIKCYDSVLETSPILSPMEKT